MKIKIDHIPRNTPHNRRPGIIMRPLYITIHGTANEKSNAMNERAWLTNPRNKRQASYHYVVDDSTIIECIPPMEVAWHAGDGNGNGNMRSIGIEMCESGNRQQVIDNTIELTIKLMHRYNIPFDKIVRHHDWSGKNCPRILNIDGNWIEWIKFKEKLKKAYERSSNMKNEDRPDKWAEEAWEYMKKNNLMDGTASKRNITRQEIAVVLYRLIKKNEI